MEAPATPFWAAALFALGLGLRLAAGGSILVRAIRLRGADGLRRIFRPASRGARLLAGVLAAALLAAGVLRVMSGGLSS